MHPEMPETLILAENCSNGNIEACRELEHIYAGCKYLLHQINHCGSGDHWARGNLIEAIELDWLIRRCLNGDQKARSEFFGRIHGVIRSYIASHYDADLVDDLCQDFYLKRLLLTDFRPLKKFKWTCSLNTWLKSLLRWFFIDEFRRKQSERERQMNDPGADAPIDADTEQRVEDMEFNQRMQEIMQRVLTPVEYDITMLYYQSKSEPTYNEIADDLKIPPGTVGSHLSRAREKLRRHLAHFL